MMQHLSLNDALTIIKQFHTECCPPAKDEMVIKEWIHHSRRVYEIERWEGHTVDLGGEA